MVAIMLSITLVACGGGEPVENNTPEITEVNEEVTENDNRDINEDSLGIIPPPPPETPPETPPPPTPPPLEITSIIIVNDWRPVDETFPPLSVGEERRLSAMIEPPSAYLDYDIIWESSDEDIFTIDADRQYIIITARNTGEATLTVTVDDFVDEAIIRVR